MLFIITKNFLNQTINSYFGFWFWSRKVCNNCVNHSDFCQFVDFKFKLKANNNQKFNSILKICKRIFRCNECISSGIINIDIYAVYLKFRLQNNMLCCGAALMQMGMGTGCEMFKCLCIASACIEMRICIAYI